MEIGLAFVYAALITAAVGGLGTLVLFAGDWLERSVDHAPADASEADAPHRDAHTL